MEQTTERSAQLRRNRRFNPGLPGFAPSYGTAGADNTGHEKLVPTKHTNAMKKQNLLDQPFVAFRVFSWQNLYSRPAKATADKPTSHN
jgi:hypothetical protein